LSVVAHLVYDNDLDEDARVVETDPEVEPQPRLGVVLQEAVHRRRQMQARTATTRHTKTGRIKINEMLYGKISPLHHGRD
jgi:hypothetical protein